MGQMKNDALKSGRMSDGSRSYPRPGPAGPPTKDVNHDTKLVTGTAAARVRYRVLLWLVGSALWLP
jgi:hypothetical protein